MRGPLPACGLHVPGRNHLLHLLPDDERERLIATMQHVKSERRDTLFDRDQPIAHIDFPLRGVVSIVVTMREGGIAEAGTIGNEGMTGIPLVLGGDRSLNRAFYQISGEALRMPADVFAQEIARRGPFESVVRRHALGYLNQVSQAAACNRLHDVEQRLCKWILMCHDRIASNTISLTQDFIAEMLGVRRASVSVVAAELQKAGLIRYSRGVIELLDRGRMEQSSCECYMAVRSEYERLLC